MKHMCPVCGSRFADTLVCSRCSFDISRDYESYPTLAVIPSGQLSAYEKRQRYDKERILQEKKDAVRKAWHDTAAIESTAAFQPAASAQADPCSDEEGMQFNRGCLSPFMYTDMIKKEAVLQNPYILITDKKLSHMQDLLPVLGTIVQNGEKLLIVAQDIEGEALTALVTINLRGTPCVAGIRAPGFGARQKELLKDIAVLTGGTVISAPADLPPGSTSLSRLGRAKTVKVTENFTSIIGGMGQPGEIQRRIEELRIRKATASEFDQEKLEEQIAMLEKGAPAVCADTSGTKKAPDGLIPGKKEYNQALVYEQSDDRTNALPLYQVSADQGYTPAMIKLGKFYQDAQVVRQDLPRAEDLFLRASDLGDSEGLRSMGYLYDHYRKDQEKSIYWNEKAVAAGNMEAMLDLGDIYCSKHSYVTGYKFDNEKALQWYHRALELGYSPAMIRLGDYYVYCKKYSEAETWYKKALSAGVTKASARLGDLYFHHYNKHEEAIRWYQKYIQEAPPLDGLSYYSSIANQYSLLNNRTETVRWCQKWYQKALELHKYLWGSELRNKGRMCQKVKAYSEAMTWYQRALDANTIPLPSILCDIGKLYEEQNDPDNALIWYKKAEEEEPGRSAYQIRNIYVQKGNKSEAAKWAEIHNQTHPGWKI